jgi:AcrR family transcriptional regulator
MVRTASSGPERRVLALARRLARPVAGMNARTGPAPTQQVDRATVVACAIELGEQGGQGAITMRAIAKRLGVNQALLYHSFEDKSALTRALTRIAVERLDGWLAAGTARHLEPHDRLFHLCLALAEFAHVHPWQYELAFVDAQAAVGSRDAWQDHAFVVRATVLLADGAVDARPIDPILVARQLCVAIHGLAVTLATCTPEPTFLERYVRALIDGLAHPMSENIGLARSPIVGYADDRWAPTNSGTRWRTRLAGSGQR